MVKAILFNAFGTLCEIHDKRSPYEPRIKAWPSDVAAAYQTLMTRNVTAGALAREVGCFPKTISESGQKIEISRRNMRYLKRSGKDESMLDCVADLAEILA